MERDVRNMNMKIEEIFVKSFVLDTKQKRVLYLLNSKHKRMEFARNLDFYLDRKYFHKYNTGCYSDIYPVLIQLGAPDICYILSLKESIDGSELRLRDALYEDDILCYLSLLICIPNKLAFYADEDGHKYILKR